MAQYIFAEIYVVTLGMVFVIYKRCGSVRVLLTLPRRAADPRCSCLRTR